MDNPISVNLWRGGRIESSHRGSFAVIDADGGVVLNAGNIDKPIYPRSAIKALQALPLIESGAADQYAFTQQEIALACASHCGDDIHASVAHSMLTKAGLNVSDLECGVHWPTRSSAARGLARRAEKPTALHNNCSGKHAGFLCVCCAQGQNVAGYVGKDHVFQRELRELMSDMTGYAHTDDNMSIDGCSIPTYAVPLRHLALSFARFGTGQRLSLDRARAAQRILAAISSAPEMIAGVGLFDTEILKLLGSGLLVKVGAEGVYCGAIPALGLGIALKCDDGAIRAAEVMIAAILRMLLNNDSVHASAFEAWLKPVLKNWNGIEFGRMEAAGVLGKAR